MGKSIGSLQVRAMSPALAAILPLILTVGLPIRIVALLDGGFWKVMGGIGIWGGVLKAVLSTVAAGIPMILTLRLRLPLMMPLNGKGIGTGDINGGGTITRCMSMARILSPYFAAGSPIVMLLVRSESYFQVNELHFLPHAKSQRRKGLRSQRSLLLVN
jgi:hypothetical protein